MRGEPTWAEVSSSTPCLSASRTCMSADGGGFLLEFFRLEMRGERVHQGLQLAIHDVAQLVKSKADAVVGYPVLGEIVGTDFFAAIATTHHGATFLRECLLLLLQF